MARYLGSRTKLCRRVKRNLFLKGARSFSAKDDYTKRPTISNNNRKRQTRLTEYGKQLMEKQLLKYTYGLMEKQLTNLFKKAFRQKGDTGKIALSVLEKRLDNVVYRSGLANSRAQARQLVNHGHFNVNGKTVDIPSFQVSVGDVIAIKQNKLNKNFWKNFQLQVPNQIPSWLDTSKKNTIRIISEPTDEDLPLEDIKISTVVEYYSRKVV